MSHPQIYALLSEENVASSLFKTWEPFLNKNKNLEVIS